MMIPPLNVVGTERHERILVHLALVGELRSLFGITRDEVSVREGITSREFVLDLGYRYPVLAPYLLEGRAIEEGRLVVFVNGLNMAHGDGRTRRLQPGDRIVLTKPLGGG